LTGLVSNQGTVEQISKTPIHSAPQKSPLPLETMSQFAEPVIPDERRLAGRDPWFDMFTTLSVVEGNPAKIQYNRILSGSRPASRFARLGRDDDLRNSLLYGNSQKS
jgi:hypothetical protein